MTKSRLNKLGVTIIFALAAAVCGCGTSIHDAAANGDVALVARILERDPSLLQSTNRLGKARGKTPLHYAVTYGQEQSTALLIAKGADVNAADQTGMTPLHIAATLSQIDEAALLIAHGADLEARDTFGDTPLHHAALFNQPAMVYWLIAAGADRYAWNNEGVIPRESARRQRNAEALAAFDEADASDD